MTRKQITLTLDEETRALLSTLSKQRNQTKAALIRDALNLSHWMEQQHIQGHRFLLQRKDGTLAEMTPK